MSDLVKISTLRPTQITIGFAEVAARSKKIAALGRNARAAYIDERAVPCVIGPQKELCLIDRHHLCRALLDAGIESARCQVVADLSRLDKAEFWRFMDLRGWAHPFDQAGRRLKTSDLPKKVSNLVDDPFRGLAGFLRRDHGFKKEDTPFEEFIWADFLRYRVDAKEMKADYDKAKQHALKLARSPEAAHMPGWTGK